ncbi:phosphoglycerate dehydrogenase [Rhodohalobacter sp. SW132]|uniref:phosphoglycerate dehydrogenase n=1 Tax=Rhodohalobacter sp. SW132 TaxID=2293433 RepID=UPI000E25A60D|nr:phosphoglycerate dehydrogenase [Rhodohalobacter sp. SW132]REL37814.1 phosphoglycerate dehydrogenase [Rhodohalobacter sp. SW132]
MKEAKENLSYPKENIKILLLEGIHPKAAENFKKHHFTNVETHDVAWSEEELLNNIEDVQIIGVRSKTQITEKVLKHAKKLKAIGCFCIGTNQVDLDAATLAGVTVFNSPYSNTRSVAELVISESIMLMRRIPLRDKKAHEGVWLKDAKESYEIRGKNIGIIGYGHIGSQVSVLAENMGLNVLYYDIEPKLPMGNATRVESMNDLLKRSDIVTLHVPATSGTEMMMDADKLSQMKKGSILLNLSRGSVVDIKALSEAIKSGHISGAGIDVYPQEPESKGEPFQSELQNLPNVILTPHIGGSTIEAQYNIGVDVSTKLINLIDNGTTVGSHSLPSLNLPVQKNAHRILHIHENKPGVLSEINRCLSDMDINILGQYLKTNEKIGYVVLDVDKHHDDGLLNVLNEVKHTIKARILY